MIQKSGMPGFRQHGSVVNDHDAFRICVKPRGSAQEKRHKAELVKLDDQIKQLRSHLHTQMEVDSEGMKQLKDEAEKLKQVNQNLRITIQTLSTKPEAAELRLLHVYDRAIRIVEKKFPVFVPTWRTVIAHVEKEMKLTDQGTVALVKRVFRPGKLSSQSAETQKLLPANESTDGDVK
jgi:hypothetical protein